MSSKESILWARNTQCKNKTGASNITSAFSEQKINTVINFHRSLPPYAVTPLHSLDNLAKETKVSKVWVKDESYRFGLNAFKGLGGSFAVAQYLCKKLGLDIQKETFTTLKSRAIRGEFDSLIFVTATDGNHGRGVAWAARQFGIQAVVYMPKGSAIARLENIRAEGAKALITELNYDDTVRLARQQAEENDWVLIQDTAWQGYEKIPMWIMQGYGTIIFEAMEQILEAGYEKPTHVFLQAGVGSYAGSILGYFVEQFGEERPITVVVEPDKAACLYKSIVANDGEPHGVTGDMDTIMAGLACGEPSTISWPILKDYAQVFVSCPDYVTARGMRILSNPLGSDPRIISGESGAVGAGLLSLLTETKALKGLAAELNLNKNSRILIISTEGDTDPVRFKQIVWDGAYSSIRA